MPGTTIRNRDLELDLDYSAEGGTKDGWEAKDASYPTTTRRTTKTGPPCCHYAR